MSDSQHGSEGGSGDEKEKRFKTPLGFSEEEFVRTVAKGNYVPTIHEFDELVIEKKVTFNEFRVLCVIKTKTINFRNTHTRQRRKDIAKVLHMDLGDASRAIKSLVAKGFILEKEDCDSYYYYAINPVKFHGVIILRSASEAGYRLNVTEKKRLGVYKPHGKSPKSLWEKAKDFMGKSHKEDELIIRNYNDFEMLKYTLLKYILLNGVSTLRSQECIRILEETQNPEFMMKQFAALLQKNPNLSGGLVEEFLRANRDGTDGQGRPIHKNAAAYIITGWDAVKHHYQNFPHKIDQSPEAVQMRKAIADLIQEYPIASNVVPFSKAGSK